VITEQQKTQYMKLSLNIKWLNRTNPMAQAKCNIPIHSSTDVKMELELEKAIMYGRQ